MYNFGLIHYYITPFEYKLFLFLLLIIVVCQQLIVSVLLLYLIDSVKNTLYRMRGNDVVF
ncbi:hypothetical protein BN1088_1432347 [Sphingobacterium sp. PM2-P1-29]|nr:hypothetical protein BN1088_1432347 [Sphingobacterium sp. PM2-P1-29]